MDCRVLLSLCALLLQLVGRLPYSYSQQPGDIRLTGYEASKTSGRLEMYLNNQWGSVCGYRFDRIAAGVACRQLGLGLPVEIVQQRFGVGSGPIAVGEMICTGTESHLLRCQYKQGTDLGMIPECQSHAHDVGIICASKVQSYEGSVRLVGGDYTSVGVAEVFLNEAWLPLCNSDNINQTVINTMCRQLGYTHAVSKTPMTFDSSDWAVVSSCSSPPECLSSCLPALSTCVSNMAAEVECGFTLSSTVTAGNRMLCTINQPTPPNMSVRINDGDVAEVYIASRAAWLRVCHNNEFDFEDADVLCKQVGYSAALTVGSLVISSPTTALALSCHGTESRVSQCPPLSEKFNCDTVAVITCHSNVPPYGSLQLYNGAGSAGSLYLFDGSVTAPVCDAEFGVNEARVACRQLGYQDTDKAVAYSNAYYGDAPHNVNFVSRSFNCSGKESHLLDCASVSIPFGLMCRSPYDIVGIKCGPTNSKDSDTVRLVDKKANGSGVLEVMVDGKWRGVCGKEFTLLSGVVACRELGYASIKSINLTSSNSPVLSSVSCAGWEEHLIDCPFSLNDCQDEIVTLECSSTLPTANGTLRLADNSTSPHSITGRLEISYNGIWMSVCGLLFSEYAADTACKQLGYTTASSYCTNACNGSSSGLVFFVEDHCTVGEDTLIQCMLDLHNQQFCSHDHDVGLTCAMPISDPIVSSISSIVPSSPSSSAAILSTGAPPVGTIVPQPPSSSSLPQYFIYAIGGGGALLASAVFVISVICCVWCCKKIKRDRGGGVDSQNSRNARLELRQQGNGVNRNGTLCSSGETSIADVKETSTDWKRQQEKLFPPSLSGYEDSASLNEGASPSFTFNGQEFSEEPPRYEQLEFTSRPIANGKPTAKQDEEEPVKLDLQHAQPSSFTSEL